VTFVPRPHIPLPTTPGLGTTVTIPKPPGSVASPGVPSTVIPDIGTPTSRNVSLEITDTQEGYIAPICYGRAKFAPKLTHFDIVNLQIELIALIGEGEIDAVEAVYIDDTECYVATQGWANVQVRLGTLVQTAVTNISNSTISAMTHPGVAYVAARLSLLTAPLKGGIPHVEVVIRGRKLQRPSLGSLATAAWSENPISAVIDAMISADYGAGIGSSVIDLDTAEYRAGNCDSQIDYSTLSQVAQTASDTDAGFGDYDRHQSFVMPTARGVRVTVSITVRNGAALFFPCILRATPDGADISADAVVATYPGNGTHLVSAWFLTAQFIPGATYYLHFPATNTDLAWRLNTLTDAYAGGKAQAKIGGMWTDVSYDHYFVVSKAECKYRVSLVINDRQPLETVARTILQTCHGRMGWWDGKYRLTLDDLTGYSLGSLIISDLQSPAPDVPLLQDSLSCGRSDTEIPNTATGEYLDTDSWTRLPVKVETPAMQAGSEQPRVLNVGFVAVPSGGQLFRLLTTWLARAGRTWRASARTMQHGLRLAPGDTAVLTSKLWTGNKTVLVDAISDAPGGTFDVALVEYAAADFSAAAYTPQPNVATTSALIAAFVLYPDDFTRGDVVTGAVGELGWSLPTGTVTYVQVSGYPGVLAIDSSGTIRLDGTAELFADKAVWAARFVFSPNALPVDGAYVVVADVFTVMVKRDAGVPTLYIDGVSTGKTCAVGDWIIVDDSCAAGANAYCSIQKNGVAWHSTSKAVSSTTVDNYLTAGTYNGINHLDYARLQLGATR
jgi:hypothetical protein